MPLSPACALDHGPGAVAADHGRRPPGCRLDVGVELRIEPRAVRRARDITPRRNRAALAEDAHHRNAQPERHLVAVGSLADLRRRGPGRHPHDAEAKCGHVDVGHRGAAGERPQGDKEQKRPVRSRHATKTCVADGSSLACDAGAPQRNIAPCHKQPGARAATTRRGAWQRSRRSRAASSSTPRRSCRPCRRCCGPAIASRSRATTRSRRTSCRGRWRRSTRAHVHDLHMVHSGVAAARASGPVRARHRAASSTSPSPARRAARIAQLLDGGAHGARRDPHLPRAVRALFRRPRRRTSR